MTNTRVHKALRSMQHDGIFLGMLVLLFAASSAVTILLCQQMSTMGGMQMPGGWTLSMTWMRMPGQSWQDVVASFMSMWSVMMVAMMLPSLIPILRRYRNSVRSAEPMRSGRHTVLFCAAYFSVWVLLGGIVFLLGVAVTTLVMRMSALASVIPMATGSVVLMAGAFQLTSWKLRSLACYHNTLEWNCGVAGNRSGNAWRRGLMLGARCCYCCAGPTLVLLVIDVMDIFTMTMVTAAITAERLSSVGHYMARVSGVAAIVAGLWMLGRALV